MNSTGGVVLFIAGLLLFKYKFGWFDILSILLILLGVINITGNFARTHAREVVEEKLEEHASEACEDDLDGV